MRDKSFTVNIIPHDAAGNSREWIITGRKLVVFRVVATLLLLVIAGALVVLAMGMGEVSGAAEFQRKNSLLSDSLAQAKELNRRLDSIELELQEIRDTRSVIENLATAGVSGE